MVFNRLHYIHWDDPPSSRVLPLHGPHGARTPLEAPILCASGGASELCCEYHQGGVLKISVCEKGVNQKNIGGETFIFLVLIYILKKTPGDSKWYVHPLVGGHLTPWKGHLTIPKRSRRLNHQACVQCSMTFWNPFISPSLPPILGDCFKWPLRDIPIRPAYILCFFSSWQIFRGY